MFKGAEDNKGVALYMVLMSIMIALVFAGIMLHVVLSQSRFSIHGAGRIQAYYAALAGSNYAIEMYRTGVWSVSAPVAHAMCQSLASPPAGCSCDIEEPNLPGTIQCVDIVADSNPGPNGALTIRATATYTPLP